MIKIKNLSNFYINLNNLKLLIKIIFFISFLLLIFFSLLFLSTQSQNFFYEIVTDFSILNDDLNLNHFILYYRYYDQPKQRYFIYGYDSKNNKFYGFSPENEFITTKPFLNSDNTAFAYGALYQGNDFVWFKDFKNKLAYKILYSISGRLSLISLDKSFKNMIVGFDYLDPQKFLYISGVKEFYTYPLTSYPNIMETGFTPDEKFVYVVFKLENKLFCDLLTLSGDPFHSSSYKPSVKNLFSDADQILYKGDSGFVTKEKGEIYFYNLKDYNIKKIDDFFILKDRNDEKNAIFIIGNLLYDRNFNRVTILENNLKLNENLLINYLKIQKNILLIDNYFIIKADDGNLYIFQLLKENKEIKLMNVIYKNIPGYEILDINNIFIFKEINGNYFFLMENKYQTTNSVSILLTKNKFEKIETVYSDNIVKLQKALNCKSGFAFLVTKQYSKGIYQELYFYSMENNNIIKISGWENVTDKELELIKRIEK